MTAETERPLKVTGPGTGKSGGVSRVEAGSHFAVPGGLCQLSIAMSFRFSPRAQNGRLLVSLCLTHHMLASKTLLKESMHVIKRNKRLPGKGCNLGVLGSYVSGKLGVS